MTWLVAGLGLVIYAPTLRWTALVYEDSIASPPRWPHLTLSFSRELANWPIETVTGMHVAALVVHILVACAVGALAWRLGAQRWSWVAAAVFVSHPIQVDTVAYVATRAELMSTGLIVLALLGVWTPNWWARIGGVAGGLLALNAKETAVVWVALAVLFWLPMWRIRYWAPVAVAIGIAAMWMVVTYASTRTAVDYFWPAYWTGQSLSLMRLLTATGTGIGLRVDADIHPWLAYPAAVFAPVTVAAVTVAAVACWVRGRAWWAFGWLWIVIVLAPRFALKLGEWLADYHWYLPMVGVSVAVALTIEAWTARDVHQEV